MKGFNTNEIIDMDILSFNDLLESVTRLDNLEKADNAYAMLMTSQGEGKAVIKFIKENYLQDAKGHEPAPVKLDEFTRMFSGGL